MHIRDSEMFAEDLEADGYSADIFGYGSPGNDTSGAAGIGARNRRQNSANNANRNNNANNKDKDNKWGQLHDYSILKITDRYTV